MLLIQQSNSIPQQSEKFMNFQKFRDAVSAQINRMVNQSPVLLVVSLDKEALYSTYLASFPEGTNPLFRERTEHDCNCCKGFIRKLGNAVSVIDGELVSIWDIDTTDVDPAYATVAKALSKFVKFHKVDNVLRLENATVGVKTNFDLQTNDQYDHFFQEMPCGYVIDVPNHPLNLVTNHKTALFNSMHIDKTAIELVLELAESGSLYRGEEKIPMLKKWLELKDLYDNVVPALIDAWLFETAHFLGDFSNLRGSSIGTLVEDIYKGVDINEAVSKYERIVAPENYKRSSAPVTQAMISNAMETVDKLGIEESLRRRFAASDDLTINNVLFADYSVKPSMGVFDAIKPTATNVVPNLDKLEEVPLELFLSKILPKAEKLEVLVTNNQVNNFVSLVAPVNPDAPNILKWGNNFSWSYNGDVTDSLMKERVKAAGGKVDGDFRFSIQWNENFNDCDVDLDAHAITPDAHIYYMHDRDSHGGMLDVDIRVPRHKVAVENITWADKDKLPDGKYQFYVNNYSGFCQDGFKAEISFLGETYEYVYSKSINHGKNVHVAEVTILNGKATFKHLIDSSTSSLEVWGVNTNEFVPVETVLSSPNHWDGEKTGLKHVFFMLKGCVNPNPVRGLYNEFLSNDLHKHRKVFELLGTKLRAEHSDKQLSGVGFSTGKSNELICKVTGSYSRTIKIIF